MYFDLDYNDKCFSGLTICPDENENPDLLYNYARTLRIKNPALKFTEIAKAGQLNNMSDDDYSHALQMIKTVSAFFNNNSEANVFHVLAEAMSFILSMTRTKEESESETEDDEESEGFEECDFDWDIFEAEDDEDSDDQ